MNFSPESAVSIENILSDVLLEVEDEDHKLFTPGYYVHLIQSALTELSLDSFFLTLWKDFDFPSDTLSITMPEGAFNIRQVFVFDSENCAVGDMREVHYKRLYQTKGANYGYTAKNKDGNDDYFMVDYSRSESILFFSLQNGKVLFSSSCADYSKVRLVYNGVQTNIGDVPIIPLPFRQAIIDWVVEKVFRRLKPQNSRKYRPLWSDVYNTLYAPFTGTWDRAIRRAKDLDSKVKEDYFEYFSKMNY